MGGLARVRMEARECSRESASRNYRSDDAVAREFIPIAAVARGELALCQCLCAKFLELTYSP